MNELLFIAFPILIALLILPILSLAFKKRKSSVDRIQPDNAVLYDVVRWGEIGKFSLLQMGVLTLYRESIVLYDKNNAEVFRCPINTAQILFVSTKMGLQITCDSKKYDVRIDYGSVPAFFSVAKRYSLWADKIKELGGAHFINDQGPVSRTLFNPRANQTYYWVRLAATLIIFLAFLVAGVVLKG